jgi:hypothetical protein
MKYDLVIEYLAGTAQAAAHCASTRSRNASLATVSSSDAANWRKCPAKLADFTPARANERQHRCLD